MRVCVGCGRHTAEQTCPEDGLPTILEGILARPEGAPDLAGLLFGGRYRADTLLGEGGMGWVYRATHVVTKQTVAIKVMRPETLTNQSMIRRFFLEAQSCSRLRQPHTIKVHDFGVSDDGYPFYVMELLEGESYREVLRHEGRVPVAEAVRVGIQVCKSLAEAHEVGLVHRDLKPSNLWRANLPGEGVYVKVLDFGLVKPMDRPEGHETLTDSGAVMGTPRYMAPEQLAMGTIDGRTDLFGLGVSLFELIAGRPPYEAATVAELCELRLSEAPPHLLDVGVPDVPPRLARFVARLMADRPDDRPCSAGTALAELEVIEASLSAENGAAVARGRRGPVIAASFMSLALLAGAAIWWLGAPSVPETAAPPTIASQPPEPNGEPSPLPPTPEPMDRPPAAPDVVRENDVAVAVAPDVVAAEETTVAATVTIVLESSPSGARVSRDGERLGETPITLYGEQGSTQVVTLRKAGHSRRGVRVRFERSGAQRVVLKPVKRAPPAKEPEEEEKKPPKFRVF